jgi:hypothetical protein
MATVTAKPIVPASTILCRSRFNSGSFDGRSITPLVARSTGMLCNIDFQQLTDRSLATALISTREYC